MPEDEATTRELRREIERLRASLRQAGKRPGGGTEPPADPQEADFHTLAQTMSAAIFIIQGDHFLYMNPAGERLCGYAKEELKALPFWQIIHPDFRDLVRERGLSRQKGEEVPARYEFKILTKDGQERWADFTAGIIQHQGKPAILGTAFDITEQKQAQEEIKDSRKRLADIINFLPDSTFAINRRGEVIVWNRAIEELTGIKAIDILGRDDYEHALPFWGERRPILADLAMEWDQTFEDRYPYVHREGHTLLTEAFAPKIPPNGAHLWGKATALFDSQGEIVGAIETVRDITKRRAMEEALRASAAKHQALVQSLPVGMISVDPEFRITEINSQGEKILGYSQGEVLGRPCGEVLRAEVCDGQCPIRGALSRGEPTGPIDTTFISKDGTRKAVRLRASGLYDQRGNLVGGVEIFQDITELKALERERANLVSMFAHDMKSPLVGIQGFALRLLKKGELSDAEKQQKYLEIIRREAAQLEKIINDFLDFTRLETGNLKLNFSAVYLDKEFLELLEVFQARFDQEGVALSMLGTESLPVIQGDAHNLRRAFTNLLDNALKYSSQGTQVRIEAEAVGDTVVLRFIDQGAGITPEELPYIFDMFFRAASHGKQPGHGLGLAGVEAIIKGHGGQVLVSSEVGKGSVFSVMLPVSQPEAEPAAPPGPEKSLV
ncbi:MAG: PAS domain S-box protein [Proteobacteria bacterium]|nr:PAS domain S-box protein [Pseudomonadota bacterium]MBU4381435.1 PAS domain S-box protein [Pseudomonadota bacterium]MBU4603365.1 PAS domain S-box protein [Pseudomonadota bacterium]MCG2764917.1 PAS domain S-box protein [Desulfarculaceae bacterium]